MTQYGVLAKRLARLAALLRSWIPKERREQLSYAHWLVYLNRPEAVYGDRVPTELQRWFSNDWDKQSVEVCNQRFGQLLDLEERCRDEAHPGGPNDVDSEAQHKRVLNERRVQYWADVLRQRAVLSFIEGKRSLAELLDLRPIPPFVHDTEKGLDLLTLAILARLRTQGDYRFVFHRLYSEPDQSVCKNELLHAVLCQYVERFGLPPSRKR